MGTVGKLVYVYVLMHSKADMSKDRICKDWVAQNVPQITLHY